MKDSKPFKPTEISPLLKPFIISYWLIMTPLILLGILTKALWLTALSAVAALVITCVFLPFLYPRVIASEEGFHIQRKRNAELENLPWEQFQCMYTFRQGITYKECGILFTTRPLNKQEQFDVAKACQAGRFRPRLTYEGHLYVGLSMATYQILHTIIPDHIQQMPEIACANVNMRFTKLI